MTYTYMQPITVTKGSSLSAKRKAVINFLQSLAGNETDISADIRMIKHSSLEKLQWLTKEYGLHYGLNYESSFNELARWKWYDLLQILEG